MIDGRRYLEAVRECAGGKPRRFTEMVLVIPDQETGHLVPMAYNPRQVFFDSVTWGTVKDFGEPFSVVLPKGRKDTATSWSDSWAFSVCYCRENVHGLVISDSDETNAESLRNWDLWYNNIPASIGMGKDGEGREVFIERTRLGTP